MATADQQADWLTRAIESGRNPFLLRAWRRQQRRGTGIGPSLAAAALTGGGLALCLLLARLMRWPLVRELIPEPELADYLVVTSIRGVCSLLVALIAWALLFGAYQLSTLQLDEEEQQSSLELLLTLPIRRGRLVLQFATWPMLCMAVLLLPQIPLLAAIMPFLGLEVATGLRAALLVAALAMILCLRAPSGRSLQVGPGGQGGRLRAVGYLLAAMVLQPIAAAIAAAQLGLEGLGPVRWPVGLAELAVQRHPWYRGQAHLGWWITALLALAAAAQWLSAWRRLSEGTDARAPAVGLARAPLVALLIHLVGGLWWAQTADPARDLKLWSGLHLAVAAVALSPACLGTGRPGFLLAELAENQRQPWRTSLVRLADMLLLLALAPVLWMLGTGASPLALTPAAGRISLSALLVGAMALLLWRRADRLRWAMPTQLVLQRDLLALRQFSRRAVAAGVVVVLLQARLAFDESLGWTGVLIHWSTPLVIGAALLGLAVWLLPLLVAATATLGRPAGERADPAPSLLWALLPARWRLNPLAEKAHRRMRRQGLGSAFAAAAAIGGGLGLVPAVASFVLGDLTAPDSGRPWWLVLLVGFWQLAGGAAANAVGVTSLPPAGAAVLGVLIVSTLAMGLVVILLAGALAGRMVTEERLAGSLGFLLLSPLSDREVAGGFLLGHLFCVLELCLVWFVVLLVWGLVGLHWLTVTVALAAMLYLHGLLLLTGGIAFLGTARYEARADGTPLAIGSVLSSQVVVWFYFALAVSVSGSGGGDLTWCGPCAIILVVANWAVGTTAWRACAGAVAWLRRSGRLWRAFEPASEIR